MMLYDSERGGTAGYRIRPVCLDHGGSQRSRKWTAEPPVYDYPSTVAIVSTHSTTPYKFWIRHRSQILADND
jgi:hypothetical protein